MFTNGGDYVGKRKKRKRRRNKSWQSNRRAVDCHHIFFMRKMYKGQALHELRDYWYCRVYLPKNTVHKAIHAKIALVPAPKEVNARRALRQLQFLEQHEAISPDDNFEMRIAILSAVFDCTEQATADALREQVTIARDFYNKPSE